MQIQIHCEKQLPEHAGYFAVSGVHLYTVLHEVENPMARVLLVLPFASERHYCYLSWVQWARYLATHNVEVLRFDYRGVGESTGVFDEMTFEDWSEDTRLLADWLNARSPGAPLLLHGVELGAVFAGRAFHCGLGDALLLWSPPATANQALRSTIARCNGREQMLNLSPSAGCCRMTSGSWSKARM